MTADGTPPGTTPGLARNPFTLAGIALTTVSAFAFITYYIIEEFGLIESPYSGIFGFFFLPALFILGLLLIPFGMWREGRRRRRGSAAWRWPLIDLANATTRRVLVTVLALTLVNIGIVAIAGFGGTHYMETTEFCGQVCHVPMKPQFTAHQAGAHANVRCVACHVSPGAAGTIRAKMNGTRQVVQVIRGNYPRPIHAEGRVPAAADTCVACHRPGFSPVEKTRVFRDYNDDDTNSENAATFDMLLARIHWHARPDVRIEFAVSDADPNVVTYIRAQTGTEAAVEYFVANVTSPPAARLRRMDCMDCHSRPAHSFSPSAERAVDAAIAGGRLARTLPFVRQQAVEALKAPYDNEAAALAGIERHLRNYYANREGASGTDIAAAVAATREVYRTNVFPEMKVTWGTHLPQIGHVDAPGCFRCHDDEHKAANGRVVTQDCELCHRSR